MIKRNDGSSRRGGDTGLDDLSIFPVEWPEFDAPAPIQHPAAVQVEQLIMRPLSLHIARVTLTVRTAWQGSGSLRVAIEPVVPQYTHVAILRTEPAEDSRPATGCAVRVPLDHANGTVTIELRIEGPQVGMVPPVLHVWASVHCQHHTSIDEAITVRRLSPRLALPDDASFSR